MTNYFYDLPKSWRKIQQTTYTFLEYSMFFYIFWISIKKRKYRKWLIFLSIGFYTFLIVFFLKAKLGRIDAVPVGVETILIFLFSLFYFHETYIDTRNQYVYDRPDFLLVAGILLYLGSSFFFNILANHVTQEQSDKYWHLTYIPEIIKNILFAVAVFKYSKFIQKEKNKESASVPFLDVI